MTDVTPLTAEEIEALYEALAFWDKSGYRYGDEDSFYRTSHNRAESHYVATVTPDRLRRLLATLDAEREAHKTLETEFMEQARGAVRLQEIAARNAIAARRCRDALAARLTEPES